MDGVNHILMPKGEMAQLMQIISYLQ